MENAKTLSRFSTFAILMVFTLSMFETSAIAPVLDEFAKAFPEASLLQVRLVNQMPFLMVFVFSVLTGSLLLKRINKKTLMIIGLIVYGISGILPIFSTDVSTILLLRLITGAGVGLVMPVPSTIIAERFSGDHRTRLLGYSQVFIQIGNVVFTILVGFVMATLGWKTGFYAFGFVFIILILVIFGVPGSAVKTAVSPAEEIPDKNAAKTKVPFGIFCLAASLFFTFVMFSFFPVNYAMLAGGSGLIPIWSIGLFMAIPAVTSIVISALIVQLRKIFRKYTIFVGFLMFAGGFAVLSAANSIPMFAIGPIILGIGLGLIPPILLDMTAVKAGDEHRNFAFGVVTSCMQLGSFISAFIMSWIGMIGKTESIPWLLMVAGIICVCAAVVSLLIALLVKSNNKAAA